MEVLRTRRTFRAFTQEPVPQEVLMDILEAGRLANCGSNRQSLRFAVAQKPEDVAKLCELTKWAAAIPNGAGTPAPEQRPTLYIVILQDTSVTGYSDIDVGIAVAGMTTAAWAKGVGSCIIGTLHRAKTAQFLNVINFTNGDRNPRALDIYYELWDGSIYPDHSFTPNMTA